MDSTSKLESLPRQRRLGRCAAAATKQHGEAADRGRDTGARRIRGTSSASPRCERQSGVWWRRLYLAGRLGEQKPGIKLLPVRVSESKSAPVVVEHRVTDVFQPQSGTILIELRGEQQENCFDSRLMTAMAILRQLTRKELSPSIPPYLGASLLRHLSLDVDLSLEVRAFINGDVLGCDVTRDNGRLL